MHQLLASWRGDLTGSWRATTAAAPNRAGDGREPGGDRNASPSGEPGAADAAAGGPSAAHRPRRAEPPSRAPSTPPASPTRARPRWPGSSTSTRSAGTTSRRPSRSCGTSTARSSRASPRTSTCPSSSMFLEMTTLKQRLVRKKNRKLRRLRELYPDIRIKLFYARDFRAMMLKYGRLAPRRVAVRARPARSSRSAPRSRSPTDRRRSRCRRAAEPAPPAGRSRPRRRPSSTSDRSPHARLRAPRPGASEPAPPTRSSHAIAGRG